MARKAKSTVFNNLAEVELPTGAADNEILDNLLEDLRAEGSEEIIEPGDAANDIVSGVIGTAEPQHDDADLQAAVETAEQIEARQAVYAAQPGDAIAGEGETPETTVEAVEATDDKASAKAAKDAEKARKKAEREAIAAKKKADKAAQPPRATSVTHKPGALLVAKLGEKWRDFVTFSVSGDEEQAKEAQDAFIARMNDGDAIADKVREKIIMLLTFVKNGGELNEVLKRTFTVLHDKGELTSGDKGNLQLNLLSKPYSVGTARSQANQMFMALPEVGVCLKEKGRMVANPDSALLPLINAALGLVGAGE